MRCISIINQKGGCGKTTVSVNLSACLAAQGRRTLLVDMDPQSHCAVGLAVPEEQIEYTIYDILIASHSDTQMSLKNVIWQITKNFDLAPAGIELAALEPQLAGKDQRENCLRNVLASDAVDYDYVVIDCPPSVGLLTFNALRAADEVIIPVETGYFALHGLTRQLETLHVLSQQCQQELTIRVLASMYDVRTKLAREVLAELRKNNAELLCRTIINFNTKLKEAAGFGQPITEYDPTSRGMKDFMALASEIANVPLADSTDQNIQTIDSQLRRISKSADELLAESQELIAGKPAQQEQQQKLSIQEKIDNFYGVRQNQGKVEFVAIYPKAKSVCLAGDFNGWQPQNTQMAASDDNGRWSIEMPLGAGRYRYRYVVDGRWQQDPYNEQVEANEFGEFNSVVEVG